MEQCKDVLLFQAYWGEHVLISEVVEYDSPSGDIKRVLKTAKRHTCFQVSMTGVQLYGIVDIDAAVPYVQSLDGGEDAGTTVSKSIKTNLSSR